MGWKKCPTPFPFIILHHRDFQAIGFSLRLLYSPVHLPENSPEGVGL
jgi:hypothetical protein